MTIIIIGHNQINEIQTCVASIRRFCDLEYVNVVVIDNCSKDGTREWLAQQEDLAYGTTEEEEGVSQILNETIEMFQLADDLLIMKPESVLTPGSLSNMYQVLNLEDETGIVVTHRDAILFRQAVIHSVGRFDEEHMNWDDALADYEQRGIAKGFQVVMTYMPSLAMEESIEEITDKLRNHSSRHKSVNRVFLKFPVASPGEKPKYSYEDMYATFYRNGWLVKGAKAAQFVCDTQVAIGYELHMERKKDKCLLMISAGNMLVEYNINQIGQAYEQLGWEVIYRKTNDFRTGEINRVIENGIDRVFVINNVGWITNKEKQEKSWWDQLGIRSYNFILDHPMYYDDTLSRAPELGTVLCVDKNHVQYIKRFYPEIKKSCFLPLGGDNVLDGIGKEWNEREIEVLYVGGYKGDLDISQLPEGADSILEKLLQNRDWTTEYAIEQELKGRNSEWDENRIKEEIIYYKNLDWYLMTYIRVEAVRALIKGGVNVTVYGSNWEKFEYYNSPHFIHKGLVTQTECLAKMKESKIVLNVMPWFKSGTHDRVINAMLAGAVCLTDGSSYMDEVFEKDKHYVCYDLQHLEQLPDIVRQILQSDHAEMRRQAYQKANEMHRWIQRIERLEKECGEE